MKRLLSISLLALAASSAFAGTLIQTGTWDGSSPRWNRPLEDGSGLSGLGIDNVYTAIKFTVSASSTYTFELGNPVNSVNNIDTFLVLYKDAFDPSNGLANFVAANDDNGAAFTVLADGGYKAGSILRSSFSSALDAGTTYYLVATTFWNYDPNFDDNHGDYGVGIGGRGDINPPVPEPASLAVLGLGALALKRRKR
ncbi:MAG: PEP-CTERM sorting domain-containing protein [Armatimonadetes bacterium]|nr:PEP-CTERM sorting domain-containing protein [Armatimonadota bacterium]